MIDQGITSLDTGAPNITYTGNEGVQSPEQEEQMLMAQLQEEYDKYVDDMIEQGIQPMSLQQFMEQALAEGQMSKGPPLPNDPTEPVNPFQPKPIGPVLPDRQMAAFGGIMGLDQRRQYGWGSKLKRALGKVTKPFTKIAQKLMPKELAGIAQFAAPFAGKFAPLLYAAGAAKQRGKINPAMLAMMAAPYARYTPGDGFNYGTASEFGDSYGLRDLITGGGRGSNYTGENLFDKIGLGGPSVPEGGFDVSPKNYGRRADEFLFGAPKDGFKLSKDGSYGTMTADVKSGLFGKGGEMYQLGNDVGILDTKAGQLAFGTPAKDTAGKVIAGQFTPSKLKLGSWAIGIVSGIQAGKYKDEQDAADAAEAAALAADSEASEATLAAARAWAIETFGSMSVYADGGRIGFRFGGNPHESDSKAGSGQTSGGHQGGGNGNRENYRTAQYITPKTTYTPPPGEKGGPGYVAPTYTPPPGEKGGQATTKDIMKNITKNKFLSFVGNRAINAMGVPTKDLQKFLSITGLLGNVKKGLGSFFFPSAGAAEIDFSKVPGAAKNFTPEWPMGASMNFGVKKFNKEYPNPTKQQFVDVLQSGDLGGATTGAFSKNIDNLLGGVNLDAKTFSTEFGDVDPQFMSPKGSFGGYIDVNKSQLSQEAIDALPAGFFKAQGGRINKNMGGGFEGLGSMQRQDVTPPGMELDLRVGGFIPIGAQEKADDVKARVSKNEFVFTADAVKAAGGGSVNEGAKRMYDTMKRLESQVV